MESLIKGAFDVWACDGGQKGWGQLQTGCSAQGTHFDIALPAPQLDCGNRDDQRQGGKIWCKETLGSALPFTNASNEPELASTGQVTTFA